MRKAETSAGTSLPHLAAVPRLEICLGCHGEQGESAKESLQCEHGSSPGTIPRSSDGLGGSGGGSGDAGGGRVLCRVPAFYEVVLGKVEWGGNVRL